MVDMLLANVFHYSIAHHVSGGYNGSKRSGCSAPRWAPKCFGIGWSSIVNSLVDCPMSLLSLIYSVFKVSRLSKIARMVLAEGTLMLKSVSDRSKCMCVNNHTLNLCL